MTMDIETIRRELRINKHTMDDALEIQAERQEQISAHVAGLNSAMLRAKENLAQVEARLQQDIREERSDRKLTKDEADAAITRHQSRREAFAILQNARESLEVWQGVYAAWVQRGKDLKELGHLFASQYFAVTSAGASPERVPLVRKDYAATKKRTRAE